MNKVLWAVLLVMALGAAAQHVNAQAQQPGPVAAEQPFAGLAKQGCAGPGLRHQIVSAEFPGVKCSDMDEMLEYRRRLNAEDLDVKEKKGDMWLGVLLVLVGGLAAMAAQGLRGTLANIPSKWNPFLALYLKELLNKKSLTAAEATKFHGLCIRQGLSVLSFAVLVLAFILGYGFLVHG